MYISQLNCKIDLDGKDETMKGYDNKSILYIRPNQLIDEELKVQKG